MTDGRHLVLVGLPGAGKTSAARGLAARLGWPLVDLDERVEALAGQTVSEVFAGQGEGAFRELEARATRELLGAPATIVSPGGGWVTRPDTVALIRARSYLVWLKVSPEAALARLGANAGGRPLLLKGDPMEEMHRLYRARRDQYATSDAWIDTEVVDLHGVILELARLATFDCRTVG